MVITGDNKLTAEAICRQIGVFSDGESLQDKSMTGRTFAELPPERQRAVLGVSHLYCHDGDESSLLHVLHCIAWQNLSSGVF